MDLYLNMTRNHFLLATIQFSNTLMLSIAKANPICVILTGSQVQWFKVSLEFFCVPVSPFSQIDLSMKQSFVRRKGFLIFDAHCQCSVALETKTGVGG